MFAFTQAMNLLGMDGIFCNDYTYVAENPELKAAVEGCMKEIGEL